MKKIVIFDLDGTLLNTLEDLTNSTNFALSCFNFPLKTINEVRDFVGDGVAKLIERAIPQGISNPNYLSCIEIFKQNYAQNMYNNTKPYDGIIDMLKAIKTNGLYTAVVSNKFDLAVKELCEKYFGDLIDFAVGEDEKNGVRKKPYPDSVLKILKNFDLYVGESIYVGDSEVDILTAKNSEIDCISVTWGFKDKKFLIEHGANIIIDAPDKILYYLQ